MGGTCKPGVRKAAPRNGGDVVRGVTEVSPTRGEPEGGRCSSHGARPSGQHAPTSPPSTSQVGAVLPILQAKKLSLGEVKCLDQSYTGEKLWSRREPQAAWCPPR